MNILKYPQKSSRYCFLMDICYNKIAVAFLRFIALKKCNFHKKYVAKQEHRRDPLMRTLLCLICSVMLSQSKNAAW